MSFGITVGDKKTQLNMTLNIINLLTSSQLASNGLPRHCFILPSLHLPQKQSCSPIHVYLSSQMAVKTRTGPGSMRKGINGFLAQPVCTTAISHIKKREKENPQSKRVSRMCCFA